MTATQTFHEQLRADEYREVEGAIWMPRPAYARTRLQEQVIALRQEARRLRIELEARQERRDTRAAVIDMIFGQGLARPPVMTEAQLRCISTFELSSAIARQRVARPLQFAVLCRDGWWSRH